jgi:beta-glucanase (GH16 family)
MKQQAPFHLCPEHICHDSGPLAGLDGRLTVIHAQSSPCCQELPECHLHINQRKHRHQLRCVFGKATLAYFEQAKSSGDIIDLERRAWETTKSSSIVVRHRINLSAVSLFANALICLVACGGGGGESVAPAPAPAGRTLVWSDEFNSPGLPDDSKWNYDTERNKVGWYNNEKQYYANGRLENSQVIGGLLEIKALRERLLTATDFGGQDFTSARLITREKFVFRYGFVEVRAKMPCGLGTWPAIWMLGTGGTWPDDGEIDLLEQRGVRASDKQEILGTIHTRAFNWTNGTLGASKGGSRSLPTACTEFHNYQVNWTPDQIQIGVNDVVYFTYTNPKLSDVKQNYLQWPFDQPQYLILNLAMGGDLGGSIPPSFTRDAMVVDYVRVYKN